MGHLQLLVDFITLFTFTPLPFEGLKGFEFPFWRLQGDSPLQLFLGGRL
jgi:hypothetical protein